MLLIPIEEATFIQINDCEVFSLNRPLGQFSLNVVMSVCFCVFVCLSPPCNLLTEWKVLKSLICETLNLLKCAELITTI